MYRKRTKSGLGDYWVSSIKDESAPLYIKIYRRNTDSYSRDKILLYELVGHGAKYTNGRDKKIVRYPIYKLITPPGAYVNTSSNNYFYIYTNDEFEHVIDPIVMKDTTIFDQKTAAITDWMQKHPGQALPQNSTASMAGTYSEGFRDLVVESAKNIDVYGTSTVNADPQNHTVQRVISGGQTGVDTIGLKVAKKIGIATGGTAPKGFERESGVDDENVQLYGLVEISDAEQAEYTSRTGKKDPYTGRTELNVRNSDGTVYFNFSNDQQGLIATRRAAQQFNKPFILNPTAEQLIRWLNDNDIKVLNVAGNRGSKLTSAQQQEVEQTLGEALLYYNTDIEREGARIKEICNS